LECISQVYEFEGHNASFSIFGVFILWFGWYGFNPGSALAILGKSDIVALSAVNTTLAAAGSTLTALLALHIKAVIVPIFYPSGSDSGSEESGADGTSDSSDPDEDDITAWDLLGAAHGTIAGLVAITAGCVVVQVCLSLIVHFFCWCLVPE
jgi:ammonia channel protein AmtB